MKIDSDDFRVPAGKKVHLDEWPTRAKPVYKSKKRYSKLLDLFKGLEMAYPKSSAKRRRELQLIRERLAK